MSRVATIVRAAEWNTDFEGVEYRVVVMNTCPNCRVYEAQAIQYKDKDACRQDRCQACTTVVVIADSDAPEADQPRTAKVGEYIGFAGAHPGNLYQVLEVDARGHVFIDFIGSYRAVARNEIRFHRPCNSLYCVACSPQTYSSK